MCNIRLKPSDISSTIQNVVDMYFKAIIRNAVIDYERYTSRARRHGITIVALDDLEYKLAADAPSSDDKIVSGYINCKDSLIPIHDAELLKALSLLSVVHRYVLLQNIVFEVPLKQVSNELQISKRMARKYRHKALEQIGRKMLYDKSG